MSRRYPEWRFCPECEGPVQSTADGRLRAHKRLAEERTGQVAGVATPPLLLGDGEVIPTLPRPACPLFGEPFTCTGRGPEEGPHDWVERFYVQDLSLASAYCKVCYVMRVEPSAD